MTDDLQQRILAALADRPGQRAVQIAHATGIDRDEVNQLLYGPLKDQVVQDRSYCWFLVKDAAASAKDGKSAPRDADTDLARLCRYYLACLGYDEAGISISLTSKDGNPDYVEVTTIPDSPQAFTEHPAAHTMLGRKRTERGRYGLYLGYPVLLRLAGSRRSNEQSLMVEPLLLYPIEQESDSGQLIIDLGFPIINQKPFRFLTNADRDAVMGEIAALEQELGLTDNEEPVAIDEIAMRLRAIRPEWPWKESMSSEATNQDKPPAPQPKPGIIDKIIRHLPWSRKAPASSEATNQDKPPLSQLHKPGIYNRAAILMTPKRPYTQGLEKELLDLARLPAERYRHTALGKWLGGDIHRTTRDETNTKPLLAILPMNLEQRSAIAAALTRPVTVITGPPGTGKSQIIINLIANAAWFGKRVLFASKNNGAVDVVETRVNALGPRPILLRVGAQADRTRLAEFVLALSSATATESDQDEYDEAMKTCQQLLDEQECLRQAQDTLIELRNDVDQQEQRVEEIRQRLGNDLFSKVDQVDMTGLIGDIDRTSRSADNADRQQAGFLANLLWPLLQNRRLSRLSSVMEAVSHTFRQIGCELPESPQADNVVANVRAVCEKARARMADMNKAKSYHEKLRRLQQAKSLEDIAKEETTVLSRIADQSAILWELWLRLQPSKMSIEDRQRLGKYTSLLRMVIEAGNNEQLSREVYAKYSAMLRDISHLLPCWAVTSLSARGRIPFEPGEFDLVIFDEASQCDIASALPLLYRAKSVVIVGDPKQLTHISNLQRGQNQTLLKRFGLLDDFSDWAYSYKSLFELATTQVSGNEVINLVDHHRSHADIIAFSNDHFYKGQLRVATRYDSLNFPNPGQSGVRWIDIKGQAIRPDEGGAINKPEIDAIVELLRDLVIDKGYQGSIGVVTPFRAQANGITVAINRDRQLSAALMHSDILSDTVHKFQGDERDVMIFSPVVSAGFPEKSLGFLRNNGNLFNVAITRARAQLVVVGDMSACASSGVDYLSRFAEYAATLDSKSQSAIDTQAVNTQTGKFGPEYPAVANPEQVSIWERTFYAAAYSVGLRLIPQYPVEKYVVDFLLVDGERQLAIEIDGERYHRNWTGELCRRDQIRNQRLFELGYDVIRFWVYEVRDDLDSCLQRIRDWQGTPAATP